MHSNDTTSDEPISIGSDDQGLSLFGVAIMLAERWRLLVIAPLAIGAITLGVSFLIPATYTAKTTFLPPPQQQSSTSTALASLGALAGLAGSAGLKTPGDQYVALMQSVSVEDRIVDRFKLMDVYKAKYRFVARKTLEGNIRISLGKKDGLISVEADANDPEMAAGIANQYVAELRRLSSGLALTEAQQRRVFFENQVKQTKQNLAQAQQALQSGGFNAGTLKTEPKAAAESYARMKAETTSAEVKLQTMRRAFTEDAPEIQQQISLLTALRSQLGKLEQSSSGSQIEDADYIGRYREFKYQEALYELFSKQFEVARLDETRDGALLQVIDEATPPEYKSKPRRGLLAIGATLGSAFALMLYVVGRRMWTQASTAPQSAKKIARFRAAWRRH